MKKTIIDYRTSVDTINELKNYGFEIILTKPIKKLYNEVKGHADMQIYIDGNAVICEPTVYNYYKSSLENIDISRGECELDGKYPLDIAYNVCKVGNSIICKINNADRKILQKYRDDEIYKIINTKQGYAKCNICIVNDCSVITSDEGVYKTLKSNGLNVLKIRQGFIKLQSMQGFIGGASGLIEKGTLAFNGDLKTHPDSDNIISFCRNVHVDTVSLNTGILNDIGSILCVTY